ncbi:hypothetical protein [Streptomyces sp. NBC_01500]|uniref:hypothetical protein n=1 Tax=Streptomyces sp. NBC_01500 TaxID=2903886 RepID=UPI0022572749|nr:hypothetical protein [Streptomyces sp. NBC_01500]MCX4554223.1 hypothetical protein [Streptomyces sp. NBC_01500]
MLTDWGTKGLKAALIMIVVAYMIQRFSIKAGIGALLMMAIALGLYNARNDLASMFADEVKNPSKSAPAFVHPVTPLPGRHMAGPESKTL